MKNPRLLMWGGFAGALILVGVIVGVAYYREENKIARLGEVFADWKTVQGKITPFQAHFPEVPEYAAQDLPLGNGQVIKQEIYIGSDKNMSYYAVGSLYPTEIKAKEKETLQNSLDGMVKAVPGGKIASSKYIVPFKGENYLEFEIDNSANDTKFKGKIFVSSHALYQVYISYHGSEYNDEKYAYFTGSFVRQ